MIDYIAYSEMLKIQVEMCFPFEYSFYKKIGINNLSVIAEIGCGNGYFLNKLHSAFNSPKYLGYDHSSKLIDLAKLEKGNNGLILNLGSIDDMQGEADGILLRLITHQVSERAAFLKKVVSKLKPDGIIVVVDAFDDKFQIFPEMPKFMMRLRELRNIFSPDNATRDLKFAILNEMRDLGFESFAQEDYFVPSLLPGYKERYRDYMKATNSIQFNPGDEIREIDSWYDNGNSYVQIGLFMHAFRPIAKNWRGNGKI